MPDVTKHHEPSRKLSPRRLRAVEALAAGATVTEAAARVGVSRETCSRWLAEHGVRTALADLRGQLAAEGVEQLRGLVAAAAEALRGALASEEPATRLRAAELILRHVGPDLPGRRVDVRGAVMHAHVAAGVVDLSAGELAELAAYAAQLGPGNPKAEALPVKSTQAVHAGPAAEEPAT